MLTFKCRLTSNIVEVVSEGLREDVVTTLREDIPSSRVLTTALFLLQTAGLRDLSCGQTSGGDILPLLPGFDSAALESFLDGVPGDLHTVVTGGSVVLHSFLHVALDGRVQVSLQQESSDTGSNLINVFISRLVSSLEYLGNEDDEEEEAVGVHHALVLLHGSAASEEGNHEDDAAEDDDEDRSVGVVVPEEVEVILGLELDVDSEAHEDKANQSEDQVEQHDDGFEEAVTTVLHDVFFYFSEDEQENEY